MSTKLLKSGKTGLEAHMDPIILRASVCLSVSTTYEQLFSDAHNKTPTNPECKKVWKPVNLWNILHNVGT